MTLTKIVELAQPSYRLTTPVDNDDEKLQDGAKLSLQAKAAAKLQSQIGTDRSVKSMANDYPKIEGCPRCCPF